MGNYLAVSERPRECEACAAVLEPGIVALSGEVLPDRLVPICPECLKSLDWRLAIAWASIPGYGSLDEITPPS